MNRLIYAPHYTKEYLTARRYYLQRRLKVATTHCQQRGNSKGIALRRPQLPNIPLRCVHPPFVGQRRILILRRHMMLSLRLLPIRRPAGIKYDTDGDGQHTGQYSIYTNCP